MSVFNELMTGLGYITFGFIVLTALITFGTFVAEVIRRKHKPKTKETKMFDHTDPEYWADYYGD